MKFNILMQIPGRIRIKIDDLYKNERLSDKLYKLKSSFNGSIFVIRPNIYTSNVLVVYDYKVISSLDVINYIKNQVDGINDNKTDKSSHKIQNKVSSIRKNLILKYNFIKKYALKLEKIKHIKKILAGLGFITLLRYNFFLALFLIVIYYLNKFLNTVLKNWYVNRIKKYTNYDITNYDVTNYDVTNHLEEAFENTKEKEDSVNTPVFVTINRIEIYVMLIGLLIYYLIGNHNILISSIVLTQMNITPLISNLTYFCAYFNRLNKNIEIKSKEKIQEFENIDTLIIVNSNNSIKFIDESLILDLRKRGILDINIISNTNSYYLNQLSSELKVNVEYFDLLGKGLMTEVCRLKEQNKKVIVVSNNAQMLHLNKKLADDINLSILITNNIEQFNNNFDIVISENNNYLIGDTIDYIKKIQEKVTQNQLFTFWIYIYNNILIFSNVAPIDIWLLALLNKVIVYFNSLKVLKYDLNLETGRVT